MEGTRGLPDQTAHVETFHHGTICIRTRDGSTISKVVKHAKRYKSGLGIAIKVADGNATSSIRRVTASEVLRQLGVSPPHGDTDLKKLTDRTLTNFRNVEVRELRAVFQLT